MEADRHAEDHSGLRERASDPQSRLEQLLRLQSLLAHVAREIGPALELEPVLHSVLQGMRTLVRFKGGSIGLLDDGAVYMAAADPAERVTPDVRAARVPVGRGLAGRVVATGETIYSPDIQVDPRVDPELRSLGSNAEIRSYLAVPLMCLGNVIGLMQVDSTDRDAFDADDLRVLEGLATLVAGFIESARHMESVRQLDRLKSDFLARVSHELRTPLTIIAGFANTLATYGTDIDTDERRRMLTRIENAAERLSALIEELLTVTQFEAGVILPQFERASVDVVLATVAAHAVDPEKVRVEAPAGLTVHSDPRLLRHALGLLVDNALKYAGDCALTAGPGPDGSVTITVADHGPGIPAPMRDRVFERFMRGDTSRPGMGLGLSLVRTLAHGINAHIVLDENDGGGARFTLSLPG